MAIGVLLIAVGIVLVALRVWTSWIDTYTVGVAFLILGAIVFLVDLVMTWDRNRRIPPAG